METMTPEELLVATIKFDPSRIFQDYDDFVDHIPVLIQLGYFKIVKLHYGKHWFYIKLKQIDGQEFRYAQLTQTFGSRGVPLEFKKGIRTVTIPYDHRIFQIIAF